MSGRPRETVLVADDDATIRRNLALLLSSEGYTVREAADGVAAAEALRDQSVALALLDLRMPHRDGMEVLRDHADRILFGSDFPNIPYGFVDAMRVLTRLAGIDDGWIRKVFHDNAAQLFGLTGR